VFLVFANLYNGFIPHRNDINSESFDIRAIIRFLRNTHQFYIRDKYPKIKQYIKQLYEKQSKTEIERIDFFFNDYFDEVLEHLNYEDEVAFPYFCKLLDDDTEILDADFSVNEYREHHTDIETKLSDLKNLLIKHISLKGDFPLKRKIVKSLFELENDLTIHSTIEELILLPLVDELEKNKRCG
jgi:regulator of cell morphogenesis and NO signaling